MKEWIRMSWLVALLFAATAAARDVTLQELIRHSTAIVLASSDQPPERTTVSTESGGARVVSRWVVKEVLFSERRVVLEPGNTFEFDAADFELTSVRQASAGIPREPRVYTPATNSKGKSANTRADRIVFLVRTSFGYELAAVGAIEASNQRAVIVKQIKNPRFIP